MSHLLNVNTALFKWLKDRKSNILSSDEIQHYCKVVSVIN